MKKILPLFLIAVTAIVLAACGNNTTKKASSEQVNVYTTVYPLQYFTEQIGGEHVVVNSIYPPGTNEHTFDPTQKDMMKLADSDLFFYIGLGLEGFVDNAKKTLQTEDVTLVETTKNIDEEKFHVSTATQEEEHDHEEEDEHHHGNIDPHVWLSPVISQDLALSIKDSLVEKNPKHKADYEANYKKLVTKLKNLDNEYKEMATAAKQKEFYVSHASFGYIAGTYGLKQVSVAGLNSQDEPTQKQLAAIVTQAKKDDIQYILFEQNVSSKLATVIQNDIGAKEMTVNNLSVLTKEDIAAKRDYFSIMEDNLKTFETVLK
ncbi:metal ABC transporter solute-binding protein, Zn/Mn family [Kurthia senegalensis]|uniref:metal ABC transporter solute-binding protein, Zn/Mn family n=1 Tax=Kurthia senegalensis TaxID=1033740 RepID=UPI000289B9EF|nr:zinc ABC transporter substrate-binding protein [Kurthia senegalensis]